MSETTFDQNNMFLDGNEFIEEAIDIFYANQNMENLNKILHVICERMHADGHFLFPIIKNEDDPNQFAYQSIETNDGKNWMAAFTSATEYEKGQSSELLSYFIDATLKTTLESDMEGIVINPWDKRFFLNKEMIKVIIDADEGMEYSVPDNPITDELLEGGEFLKRAINICNRNHTSLNHIKLIKILRASYIWVPCTAIMGEKDQQNFESLIQNAIENNDLESIVGKEYVSQEDTRMVPDILQSGDEFYFPVFSSAEEMGEYGSHFSKVEMPFLNAINLARNNEKHVKGIVINAFSEPFEIPTEIFEIIEDMAPQRS